MADIASSTVFTNGVACSTSDLLRQAFQEVVDDEDPDNEFVAFLQGEGDIAQAIHLTHAQASTFRLTFDDDPADERNNDDITYHQEQSVILDDIENPGGLENGESSPPPSDTMDALSFQTSSTSEMSNVARVECPQLQEWVAQEASQDERIEGKSMPMETLEASEDLLEQLSGHQDVRKIYIQQNSARSTNGDAVGANDGEIQFAVEETAAQNFQQTNVPLPRTSQAPILQTLPVILPSSQFILKPAHTILKSAKNIRILPSTNKIGNIAAINGNAGQNSILLPKGVLNTLSSQMIKATTIAPQLINNRTISAQLLNSSQILTTNCDFQSRNGGVNSASSTQGLINTPIRLSPAIKTATGMIQRTKGQQFVMPTLKTSQDGTIIKSVQVSNGSAVKTGISGQFLKSVQIPAQMLRTVSAAFVKTTAASSTPVKMTATTNTPIIFRTASLLKAQDFKTVTTNTSSVSRASTQSPSTPVSILKPQTKAVIGNTNRQNLIINGQNRVASPQNARFVQKTTNSQVNDVNERLKTVQTGLKQKASETALATARVVKKAKVAGLQNPVALTAEQTDTTKPLGSSENPIQIVQQGHTFHSMQRLTQSQLKQIAHVLQQRSQETPMPNEKIVYRVVFPEELDLRMRNPGNLLKGRGGKRGRPKKTAVRPAASAAKIPTAAEEEHEEIKDDRKKVVARTRSGRLSRPPRHMVRDYKHLHHLDFTQPDLDDSDGGYSDYNTNAEKMDTDGSAKELLSGLEVPKRKIADHFRCPTCSKIYLGRTRMARHFEMHPDHGSPEQLPPPTPDPDLKRAIPQDPLKRKGKKRGPWAYVTPEAKSERRQVKLKEAISVCENLEIINIAAKPVVNAQSLFDLLVLKSDNNVKTFLSELKDLMDKVREQVGAMLTVAVDGDGETGDVVDLHEDSLCDALGLDPGVYRINAEAFRKPEEPFGPENDAAIGGEEPPLKLQKTHEADDCKETLEERMSSGFSESSDMSVSDFLNERKNDLATTNCPEVLTALTLMPRNPSPINAPEVAKATSMSKLLISNPEIQSQISENPGFQKIDINSTKSYRKLETLKDGFAKLTESLELTSCSPVFTKLDASYEQPKHLQTLQQAFIKLEPMEQGFKLENSTVSTYGKDDSQGFDKMPNGYETLETTGSTSFAKGFHKLISKIVPMQSDEICIKNEASTMDGAAGKMLRGGCKITDDLPILQDSVPIMSGSCDASSIFGSTDNLDIGKMTGYDHIPHLDILTTSGVIDKHLIMDEKLVEQLHLVDQTNLVDELVSERLKNIMPDNILENNLIPNGSNLDTDLDFEALSEEFNRNTRS